MRFFYKKYKPKDLNEELNMVFEVMSSEFFVFIDLIIFSLLATLFMFSTPFHSILPPIIFFSIFYLVFACIYRFIFCRLLKKDDLI